MQIAQVGSSLPASLDPALDCSRRLLVMPWFQRSSRARSSASATLLNSGSIQIAVSGESSLDAILTSSSSWLTTGVLRYLSAGKRCQIPAIENRARRAAAGALPASSHLRYRSSEGLANRAQSAGAKLTASAQLRPWLNPPWYDCGRKKGEAGGKGPLGQPPLGGLPWGR